jgi:hypothetical protein
LTRTTSDLFVSGLFEGVAMLQPKTHFEQVPLETVRKIVAEQILREIASQQDQETRAKSLQLALSRAREPLLASSRSFSHGEIYRQS